MLPEKLLHFALLGAGWVLWLLLGLSILTLALVLDRAAFFARRRTGKIFPSLLRHCLAGNFAAAERLAPAGAMEAEIISNAALLQPEGRAVVDDAIAAVIEKQKLKYEKSLFILGTLGNNAPFVGLLGTVIGIVQAFEKLQSGGMSAGGGGPASDVMGAIAEALVATAIGLVVAIPAVAAFNYFQKRIKSTLGNAEAVSHILLAYAKAGPVSSGARPLRRSVNPGLSEARPQTDAFRVESSSPLSS